MDSVLFLKITSDEPSFFSIISYHESLCYIGYVIKKKLRFGDLAWLTPYYAKLRRKKNWSDIFTIFEKKSTKLSATKKITTLEYFENCSSVPSMSDAACGYSYLVQ